MTDGSSRRVRILREDVSRKIAAGEVIDRPFSVLRELLDNSIDAGAANVEAAIEGGGQARVRVADDGAGMTRDDLALCWQRHATSKIRDEGDLYRVRTLGFRGEALAAIAACSRLSVVSRLRESADGPPTSAHRLVAEGGRQLVLEGCPGPVGTAVDVADLFFNLPARRRFLKSLSAESALCRQSLLEKAIPHPHVAFRFSTGGELKHFFPALRPEDYRGRVVAAFGLDPALIYAVEGGLPGLAISAVVGRPELTRRDRRMIQIHVNRRRIYEYGLVQAAEYAYSEYVPGGNHPVVFLFLEVDPAEVDFNIHPAKREVRFRDLASVRRLVAGTLRDFLKAFDLRLPGAPRTAEGPVHSGSPALFPAGAGGSGGSVLPAIRRDGFAAARPAGPGPDPQRVEAESSSSIAAGPAAAPIFRGQLFRLFLLVEYRDTLFVVDQHAAHERILFEQLKDRRPISQELLMPISVEAGPEAEALLERSAGLRERLGVRVERVEAGGADITALPEELLAIDERELVEALLWQEGSLGSLEDRVFSLAACRLAVKEGQDLDTAAAAELVRRVFALENARCPHGRPIWTELRREDLEHAVGRE